MKQIAIVIANWNLKDDTLACLGSLQHLTTDGLHITVIVVDNGSTDDSVAAIRQRFPKAVIIENKKNLGFTGGNNVGIDYALKHKAEYVWLLNNDTVVDSKALTFLADAFNQDNIGICGSKIYFYRGREYHKDRYQEKDRGNVLWYAGGLIDWRNMYASHRGVDEVDKGQYDVEEETPFITGCSMIVSSCVFDKIGLLDDKFYLYLEDLDLCLRAKKAGYRLLYVPESKIWHKNAGSTSGPGHSLHRYYFTRNRLLIGMRYAPLRTKLALLREALRFLINGESEVRKAVVDAILGRYGEQFIWKTINQK